MKFQSKYYEQPIKEDMMIIGRAGARTEAGGFPVFINGLELSPEHSQSLVEHSPDGFSWGYGGSGPAQLALALLLAAGVKEGTAMKLHQKFKEDVVAKIPGENDFRMKMESVRNWVRAEADNLAAAGEELINE